MELIRSRVTRKGDNAELHRLDDEGGGVVAAGLGKGGGNDGLSGRVLLIGFCGAQEIKKSAVVEAIDDAVAAEEEDVAGFVGNGANLRFDELVTAAERFLEDVAARMRARFAFVEFAVAEEPADVSVIVAELLYAAFALRQVINARVADVAEEHPTGREPAETEGGFHAAAFFVGIAHVSERAMRLAEKLGEDIGEAGLQAGGGLLEGAREEFGDFFNGDAAGEFAGVRPTHAIAHGEGEVGFSDGRFADLAEVMNVVRIELQADEGVFVVLADFAAVRATGPLEGSAG